MAYLSGWDAINDLERVSSEVFGPSIPNTQPPRVGFNQAHLLGPLWYRRHLRPLLVATEEGTSELLSQLQEVLHGPIAQNRSHGLLQELLDAWTMTTHRARFGRLLFDHTTYRRENRSFEAARALIGEAAEVVAGERLIIAPQTYSSGTRTQPRTNLAICGQCIRCITFGGTFTSQKEVNKMCTVFIGLASCKFKTLWRASLERVDK